VFSIYANLFKEVFFITIQNKIALTINESAEYTNIGRNTLRNLIQWNKLSVLKVGNKILIRKEILDKFVLENQNNNLRNKHEVIAI
jgi:DNA binding domain, excisionase family